MTEKESVSTINRNTAVKIAWPNELTINKKDINEVIECFHFGKC